MDEKDLKRFLDANAEETRTHFDASVQRVEAKMDASVQRVEAKMDASVQRVEAQMGASVAEMRRHFDVTAERLESKFQIVVEVVANLDEKLEREAEDIRQEMRRGFAETQAMIKFSHAELDRRVRALEDGLSDLQARVERLEGSTQ